MTGPGAGREGDERATAGALPACMGVGSHVRRLVEIERALAELGVLFRNRGHELAAAEESGDEALAHYVDRVRVAGFFAYCMAREGVELVRLAAAAAAIERATPAGDGAAKASADELDEVLQHVEQIGPLLHQTLRDMEPYRELDSAQTLEMLAARRGEQRR